VDAYWGRAHQDTAIVDVTGAGNAFLGGLAAGLAISGDVYDATFYAAVSASFTVEQQSLPTLSPANGASECERWNGDDPKRRLEELRERHGLGKDGGITSTRQ